VNDEAPIGASSRFEAKQRSPCGDVIERRGDELVVDAKWPIEGLEADAYRKSVLVVSGERFVLVSRDGNKYKLRRDDDENLYEPRGEVVYYDGDRHLERQVERKRIALGWLIWFPMVPLMPLLGLLPQSTKAKLVEYGLNADRATRMSLTIEWLLVFFGILAYFFSGGFFTLPGFAAGALTSLVALDIAYRVTADADNQSPGAFAVVGALAKMFREGKKAARGEDRLLPGERGEK
jgi:hypothetical protein